MKKSLFILLLITITMGLLLIPGIVSAQNKVIINVLTQPRREWELLEQYLPEFEEKENIDVVFHYFAELEEDQNLALMRQPKPVNIKCIISTKLTSLSLQSTTG